LFAYLPGHCLGWHLFTIPCLPPIRGAW
jgi:hypothetical protein